jgi:pyridoxine kinase
MPMALLLSSHVAGSRVGGSAQALALAQFKIDPVAVPTVLYGRHPGWGAPGGAQVPIEAFEGMLDGIEANGLFGLTDLVITGYFASVEQVRAAGRAIEAVRGREAWLAAHQKADNVPSGTGDLLAALFAAAMLEGQTPSYGLARAVGGVAETVAAAGIWQSPELPIVAVGAKIKNASPTVRMERLG